MSICQIGLNITEHCEPKPGDCAVDWNITITMMNPVKFSPKFTTPSLLLIFSFKLIFKVRLRSVVLSKTSNRLPAV